MVWTCLNIQWRLESDLPGKTREEIYGCGERGLEVSGREWGERMQRTRGDGVIGNSPKEKEEDKEHLSMLIYTKGKYSIKKLNQKKKRMLVIQKLSCVNTSSASGGRKKKFSVEARPPFGATDVQSGSQVRCLPPRQPSRYGRERDDVETHGALPQRF